MRRHDRGGAGWFKRRALNRRIGEHVRTTDEVDLGNRPLVETILSTIEYQNSAGAVFRRKARDWFVRCPF